MTEPSLTTLIGDEIEGYFKWSSFVNGKDGFFYGIHLSRLRSKVAKEDSRLLGWAIILTRYKLILP